MNPTNRISSVSIILLTFVILTSGAKLFAAHGTVKVAEAHQTMVGFGASIAWSDDILIAHPYKSEIYSYLFDDLGLDVLRLRSTYAQTPMDTSIAEVVRALYRLSPDKPKVMLCLWSPPWNLKSNSSLVGPGTLTKVNGRYTYGPFAQHWVNLLNAYKAIGIMPDYIGIQNEPDYGTGQWETCYMDRTESSTRAGYDRALDSVYKALQQLPSRPPIIGPEVLGIGYNEFQNYAQYFNHNHLDVYAYHLYHGESDNVNDNHNPDLFIPNLSTIASSYSGKPIFQTEYDRGDWFNMVRLMNNCLVYGNVSAYFYWELVWGSTGGKPLLTIEDPHNSSSWKTPHGFSLTTEYWAFRQYSKFVSSGWKRVTAQVDGDSLRISAFINPEGSELTLVVLNIGTKKDSASFDIQNFTLTKGTIVRTSGTENGVVTDTAYTGASVVQFPARSISTISLSGDFFAAVHDRVLQPAEFSLQQNYPNPFNPTTTINYSIAKESYVQLNVYDILGRVRRSLVGERLAAGNHTVNFDGSDLDSGIYFYQIRAGDFIQAKKMILVK